MGYVPVLYFVFFFFFELLKAVQANAFESFIIIQLESRLQSVFEKIINIFFLKISQKIGISKTYFSKLYITFGDFFKIITSNIKIIKQI